MASINPEFLFALEKLQALSEISRIRVDHDDPSIPIPSPVREMERETRVTKDQVLSSDNGSTKYVQPTVIQPTDYCVSPGDICFYCKSPMENSYRCFRCICEKCGNNCSSGYCTVCNRFINQIQTYSCEYCGGPHYSSDCQARNQFIYEQVPCNNHEFGVGIIIT